MDRIGEKLYVGSIRDAASHERQRNNDIDAVVRLSFESPDNGYAWGVEEYNFPMMDGPRNDRAKLEQAVEKTVSLIETDHTVLVHCSAGESRSVGVSVASLALLEDWTFEKALEEVSESRTAKIHPAVREHSAQTVRELRRDRH
jgi:protein-tyrosine phosphatase